MKKKGQILIDQDEREQICPICGGNRWSLVKQSDQFQSETWLCDNGCMRIITFSPDANDPIDSSKVNTKNILPF